MAQNLPDRLRVMVDANVLVAGSAWPRFSYEVLQHAVYGDYDLVLSARILQEARAALVEIAPLEGRRLEDILAASQYEETLTPTGEEIQANAKLTRDPKDIHVAVAAINARVDCLISQDKDLTDPNEPLHQRLTVLLPGTFLREYMEWTSEALEAIRTRAWEDLDEKA